jgi:hypothetical protein
VPGRETLPKRIFGFEQVVVGDLDERKTGHVLSHVTLRERSLRPKSLRRSAAGFSPAPPAGAGVASLRMTFLNYESFNSVFQIRYVEIDQKAEAQVAQA